ncbi:unnamed protein product, partial [marine sediment metagenome]
IRDKSAIPKSERGAYRPLLTDRQMSKWRVPGSSSKAVFYPYVEQERLSENDLKREFPETWKYLRQNSKALKGRAAVRAGNLAWWSPERPRPPQHLMRPKIVSPHLVLLPRFSLDATGRFAVSHCPLMYPRVAGDEEDMLRFFLAVLNSTIAHWQIAQQSHKYSRGYLMLEPKTLRTLHVPDPAQVPVSTMKKLLANVARCLQGGGSAGAEAELDRQVAELYGLSAEERAEIGMEG